MKIKYVIYDKDNNADQKVNKLKTGFKNLADEYNKKLEEAKKLLDDVSKIETLVIKEHPGKAEILGKLREDNKNIPEENKSKPEIKKPEIKKSGEDLGI